MSDWWSKKLAGEKPSEGRRTFTPIPTGVPPIAPPMPATAPQQTRPVEEPPAESFSEALKRGVTNGGEAARRDTMTCPACGGNYVFSRTSASGATNINGSAPAPRCYTCGWNGRFQQGEQSNWA